jgi:hypothetical protein
MPHYVVSTQKKTAKEGCFRAVFPRVLPGTGFIDRRRAELAGYMLSIMTCPNPEQLTWVAPSIRRAKS